jgi:hypothetical protein
VEAGKMKNPAVFLFTILIVMCTGNAHSEQINIDLSSSTFEITGPVTFIVHNVNVSVPGLNGNYWAEFHWDPFNYVFVPTTVGLECVPPATAVDVTGNYSGIYTIQFPEYDPRQYTVQVSLSQTNSNISGAFSSPSGDSGKITGAVTGNNITLTFTSLLCTNSATAQGGYNNGVLNFSGNGNLGANCGSSYYGAYTFYGMLNKQ